MRIEQHHITVGCIEVGERMREVDEAHVDELAGSIETHGLLDAIWVREVSAGKYKLLAGAHRLSAVKILGQGTVRADVWRKDRDKEVSDLEDKIAEIVENFARKDLEYSQRSLQAQDVAEIETAIIRLRELKTTEAQAAKEKSENGKVSANTRKAAQRARDANLSRGTENGHNKSVKSEALERVAKEEGKKKSTTQKLVSHGRAIRRAASIAGVEPKELAKKVTTKAEVEALSALVSRPINDDHEKAVEHRRQKENCIKSVAKEGKAKDALKVFDRRFDTHEEKVEPLRHVSQELQSWVSSGKSHVKALNDARLWDEASLLEKVIENHLKAVTTRVRGKVSDQEKTVPVSKSTHQESCREALH